MEKILIFEDEKLLEAIIADLGQYQPSLAQLKAAYEALELGEFNDEVFTDLKAHRLGKLIAEYEKNLEDQLDSAGIKNTNLRRVSLEGTEVPKRDLYKAHDALKAVNVQVYQYGPTRHKTLDLSEICFKDGIFQVENVEAIAENHCRVYLNDEKDRELYAKMEKVKNAINEFYPNIKELGYGLHIGGSGLDFFFNVEGVKLEIRPYSVKDARNFLSKQKAMQDAEQMRQQKQSEARRANSIRTGIIIE